MTRAHSSSDITAAVEDAAQLSPDQHALRRTYSWGSFKSVLRRSLRRGDKDGVGSSVGVVGGAEIIGGTNVSGMDAAATEPTAAGGDIKTGLFGGLFKSRAKLKKAAATKATHEEGSARQMALGVLVTDAAPAKAKADFFKSKRVGVCGC